MGTKDAAGPGYGPKRLGDVDFLKEVACQNERKNWVASRIGLPTIGTSMENKHGIEWVVQNHAAVPTADTLQRWRARDIQPTNDLYPVVAPKNLSPKLLEFIAAVDRCTTKTFAVLDTMPGRRKDGHVPGGNSIDTLTQPETNLLFLDAARVSETVIAHEIGHAWVQYVDECEDLRTLEDASDPQRMKQVSFVQSFVLDLKVNDLIARKGFDVSSIRDDQRASIQQLSEALRGGYRPKHPREEVFMALLVADEFIQRDRGEGRDLALMDNSLETIRGTLAPLASLADRMAEAVRKYGYDSHEAITSCIDECLLASFEHCNDRFDLDSEIVVNNPEEPNMDKFPKWLPQLPPKSKCVVGKHMARNDISSQWAYKLEPSITSRAMVGFRSPESDRQSQILLNDLIGPPTRYCHLSEVEAMNLSMKIRNRTGSYQIYGGPPHNAQADFLALANPAGPLPGQIPGQEGGVPGTRLPNGFPKLPDWPHRPYMAGLGRFLTSARLADQLGGEHPYAYALSNPVTYTDPTGLNPKCKKDYDDCLRDFADKARNRCRNDATDEYTKQLKHCLTLIGWARTECNIEANAVFEAKIATCITKTQVKFDLCLIRYEECLHAREIAEGLVKLTIAAGIVYGVYRGCKLIIAVAGAPETGGGSLVLAASP